MLPVVELGLMPPRQRRLDIRTQEERDDDKILAINKRISVLLAGEFSPDSDENIAEALDNLTDEQIEIRTALVKFSNVNGTQIMKQWVRQYWELRAEEKAIEELS